KGLIYRGEYMVNWCPRCQTVLSDLEVKHEETQGHLWHIRYPVVGTDRHLVVATTRPETMLGDTAVAINPRDARYSDLHGKTVMPDLEQLGLVGQVEDYRVSLGRCERTKDVVEPLISTQWFVKIKPLAERAVRVVDEGKVVFVPDTWPRVYHEWMDNIRDW